MKTSIIIRSKNEEKWLGHCLFMVRAQTDQDFEIILVDSGSTDSTIDIAKKFSVEKIINIKNYLPGLALNQGIEAASGEFIVCLSSHCIPVHNKWLSNLLSGLNDPEIAGVYGRQVPLPFTSASNKRDLLITFGLDRRIQVKDYFFHNANSVIRKKTWQHTPFSNTASNIEDRIWAKEIVEKGLKLLYEPDAPVYHHHGIHHGDDGARLEGTVKVLEGLESSFMQTPLPTSMLPQNVNLAVVLPITSHFNSLLLGPLITELKISLPAAQIYLVSELIEVKEFAGVNGLHFLQRPANLLPSSGATIEMLLKWSLESINQALSFPELVLYVNYLYSERPNGLFKNLLDECQYKGLDCVFPAVPDYSNFWFKRPDQGDFQMLGDWKPHQTKDPIYKAINGLGTITRVANLRAGKLVGGQIGLHTLDKIYDKTIS